MATVVLSLPFSTDRDVDNGTIYDNPGNHLFTFRKITPADNDMAIYMATSLQYEGAKSEYSAKQPRDIV